MSTRAGWEPGPVPDELPETEEPTKKQRGRCFVTGDFEGSEPREAMDPEGLKQQAEGIREGGSLLPASRRECLRKWSASSTSHPRPGDRDGAPVAGLGRNTYPSAPRVGPRLGQGDHQSGAREVFKLPPPPPKSVEPKVIFRVLRPSFSEPDSRRTRRGCRRPRTPKIRALNRQPLRKKQPNLPNRRKRRAAATPHTKCWSASRIWLES